MMPRPTMLDLIERVRQLIGDPESPSQVFDADQIQNVLDERQTRKRYWLLEPVVSYQAGGSSVQYTEFHTRGATNWEQGVEIVNNSYTVVTPSTSDLLAGRFIFASSQQIPLFISGYHYNIYQAAADLLERSLATLRLSTDRVVSSGSTTKGDQSSESSRSSTFEYSSQKFKMTRLLIEELRAQGGIEAGAFRVTDVP